MTNKTTPSDAVWELAEKVMMIPDWHDANGYCVDADKGAVLIQAYIAPIVAERDNLKFQLRAEEETAKDFHYKWCASEKQLSERDTQIKALRESEAVKALDESQYQVDADGTMVGVSRQALHEVLQIIASTAPVSDDGGKL